MCMMQRISTYDLRIASCRSRTVVVLRRWQGFKLRGRIRRTLVVELGSSGGRFACTGSNLPEDPNPAPD